MCACAVLVALLPVRISVQVRFVDGSGLNCFCSVLVRWRFGSDSVWFVRLGPTASKIAPAAWDCAAGPPSWIVLGSNLWSKIVFFSLLGRSFGPVFFNIF